MLKDDLYAEIEARRQDREGQEGANTFDGITSASLKDEMVSALKEDDNFGGEGKEAGGPAPFARSAEKAGVGTPARAKNEYVPDDCLIPKPALPETSAHLTEPSQPEVDGDKTRQIIDLHNLRPVMSVHHIPSVTADPDDPDHESGLIFVQGVVNNDLMPVKLARGKFAIRPDGTVIYAQRGFDDIPKDQPFELVDIVKLIEHNRAHETSKAKKEAEKEE